MIHKDMGCLLLFSVIVTVSFVFALSNSLPSSFRNRSGSSWNIHRSAIDRLVQYLAGNFKHKTGFEKKSMMESAKTITTFLNQYTV